MNQEKVMESILQLGETLKRAAVDLRALEADVMDLLASKQAPAIRCNARKAASRAALVRDFAKSNPGLDSVNYKPRAERLQAVMELSGGVYADATQSAAILAVLANAGPNVKMQALDVALACRKHGFQQAPKFESHYKSISTSIGTMAHAKLCCSSDPRNPSGHCWVTQEQLDEARAAGHALLAVYGSITNAPANEIRARLEARIRDLQKPVSARVDTLHG